MSPSTVPSFLTIGQAASQFGLHPNTLRRWSDSGKLQGAVSHSLGSHRYFDANKLSLLLGISEGPKEGDLAGSGEGKLIAYCRVSGNKQGKNYDTNKNEVKDNGQDSDLSRQVDDVQAFCLTKYGKTPTIYSDIGSGLSYTRKNFEKLLSEILQNKWNNSTLVINHKDRLARFGTELIELILKSHSITLDIVNRQDEVSDEEEMATDLMSIIHVYSCRSYSQRSAKNREFHLSPDAVELAVNLKQSGYTVKSITKELIKQGFVMTNSRGSKPVTLWVVSKVLENGQGKLLTEVFADSEVEKSSFNSFVENSITKTDKDTDKVSMKEVLSAYSEYCQLNGFAVESVVIVGKVLKTIGKKYLVCGRGWYRGLKLAN